MMMGNEKKEKIGPTQIVTLNKALKLAEQWVGGMTKTTEDEQTEGEKQGRPSRLGLGAKVVRQAKVGPPTDPISRNLYAKIEAAKRKAAAKAAEESIPSAKHQNNDNDEDDSDEEPESRTRAFDKKRAGPNIASPLQLKKKKK